MQAPFPGGAHERRLRVQRLVLAPHAELEPALRVERQGGMPGVPCEFVFRREVELHTSFDAIEPFHTGPRQENLVGFDFGTRASKRHNSLFGPIV